MGIHVRKKFLEQLKGTYIDYEKFFHDLAGDSIDDGHFNLSLTLTKKYSKYYQYFGTDTDIDWKTLSFRLLYDVADYDDSPWFEGFWVAELDLTEQEYHTIIRDLVKWTDKKIRNEKLFYPLWFKKKLIYWQAQKILEDDND